jgi:hypothetical protein
MKKFVKPMKRMVWCIAAVTALAVAVSAQAAVQVNVSVPIEQTVFIPCANGGLGEDVVLVGPLHVLMTLTVNQAGGFSMKTSFQPQGVVGIGMITGDIYHATGLTHDQTSGALGGEYTYVNNFRIIGPGPGNNYLVHETYHITINANGQVAVEVDNFSSDCK